VKKWVTVLLVLMTISVLCETAEARRRWRRRVTYYSSNTGTEWTGPVAIRKDDQAACQREAEHMAKHGIRGHVFGLIGRFEGCGWGARGKRRCDTCRPGSNMTLTGDAEVTSAWGEKFRVRSWR
jgi:hypothetical protein